MRKTNKELEQIALQIRRDIVEMIYKAQTGHPGGSLSATEILIALYFEIMGETDRFFLSNGHVCPALYAVMAEKGMIEKSLLDSYSNLNSPLQGHPERTKLEVIMNTSGPLGLGLAQAAGYAAIKKDSFVYCMTSDGEHDEGNHWEAVNFAAKYELGNLIQFIDRNRIQIEGTVEVGNIFPLGTWYAERMHVYYTDEKGLKKPIWFASYGIGPTRVMGTLVEVSHDDKGIIWYPQIAPFDIHLVELPGGNGKEIYEKLKENNIDVLWDDRDVAPGEKFADADLIGIPVRLVVSERNGDKIEWKERTTDASELLDFDEVIKRLKK